MGRTRNNDHRVENPETKGMTMTVTRHKFCATTILLMGTAAPLYAQNVPAAPSQNGSATSPDAAAPGTPAGGTDTAVGEIVVTAQKRSESLQKVPIVITAVSGAQLATAGITSLATLNTLAPGLNSRNTAGAFQPSIRGIGTSSNVVENPVALYIDGVYLPQQREGVRELPDVEQVAVLKGPQGTLFGRNATGGVIQITTRQPTQQFEADAHVGIESYETVRAGAFVSGGLAPSLAASFSVDYAHQGNGYGTNLTTGDDTFQLLHSLSLRSKLVWDAASDTKFTLIADYMDRRDRTYSFIPYKGTSFIQPIGPLGSKFDTYSPVDPFSAFRGGGISLTAEHDFDFAKLVSISSYRQGSSSYLFDDTPVGKPLFFVQVAPGAQPNKDVTQELQLVSNNDSRFTWTVGVFGFYNRIANLPITRSFFPGFYGAIAGPPAANEFTQTSGAERTESIAPYGQVGIELFKDTRLTIGGRYTYEKRELHDGEVSAIKYSGAVVNTAFAPGALTIKKPTWRIALDHQFGTNVLGYLSYNRGIKSGGFNILNPANPAYLPERLDAYEAGLKTELFDRRLRLNVGGFYYNYNNLQVTQFVNLAQSIVNGAKARLYGLDADFNARLTPELSLSGGLEALHGRFTSYNNAVGSIPKATGGATLISIDATGNRIPQAQKFVGTLSADYEKAVSFGSLHYNATASYNGDYYFEPDNFLKQGAYVLVNTSLAWTSINKRYTISIWGKNLANERVLSNASSQAVGYPVSYGGQPPRTFGITGKVSFR
jgi:iron complex outermembrane receptor protein